jgi:hypothetical protein
VIGRPALWGESLSNAKLGEGVSRLALLEQHPADQLVCARFRRIQLYVPAIRAQGVVALSGPIERACVVELRWRRVGIESHELREFDERRVDVPTNRESGCERAVNAGVVRCGAQRVATESDGSIARRFGEASPRRVRHRLRIRGG